MKKGLLAGLSRAEFMRRHWQKKPLIARSALPDLAHIVGREELFELAQREDVESRIVRKSGRRWHVEHGPFRPRDFARLPRSGWTLLVQGVDHKLPQAAQLMSEFAFIPYARLDDVMVSYAAPGGGVGPHFDSYDVFLLQGRGERRWRVSRQDDLELIAAPLRILRRFRADHEWRLAPGDLLYLPPRCAHDGIAVGECITYSIGFRAPSAVELGRRFLEYLTDGLDLSGMYEDPDLQPTRRPGQLPPKMLERAASMLEKIRWSQRDITRFMGAYLTEPKPYVVFARPKRAATLAAFTLAVQKLGLTLALPTRMLVSHRDVFINGESHRTQRDASGLFAKLADARRLEPPVRTGAATRRLLYEWYRAGYIEVGAGRSL